MNATTRLQQLRERLGRYRAEQALDGANHKGLITKTEQEIAGLEAARGLWPDVEAELERRIQAAEAAHTAVVEAERQRTLAELATQESELRGQFAAIADQLFEIAAQSGDIRQAREQIRMDMNDEWVSGKRANMAGAPINSPLPEFPARLLFDRQNLERAKAQLRGG